MVGWLAGGNCFFGAGIVRAGISACRRKALYGEKIFAVSVGGSVIFRGGRPDAEKISAIASAINSLAGRGCKFAVIVGGGRVARDYVSAAKNLGASCPTQDTLGICITRANAMLFIEALENAHPAVLTESMQAHSVIDAGKIAVFGGMKPGMTTDGVGALVAEALGHGTIFINLTNVDGVYTADPRKDKSAKLVGHLGYDELIRIVSVAEHRPGQNMVLDISCCRTLKRAKIPALVLNGSRLVNFEKALRGEKFRGTVVGDF